MVKRFLSAFVQFALFCGLFYVGGFWAIVRLGMELRAMQHNTAAPPMIPLWKLHISPAVDYVANGLVFASVLLVLILLIEALRRRLRISAPWTLAAFALAFLLSLLLHSGIVPVVPAG